MFKSKEGAFIEYQQHFNKYIIFNEVQLCMGNSIKVWPVTNGNYTNNSSSNIHMQYIYSVNRKLTINDINK